MWQSTNKITNLDLMFENHDQPHEIIEIIIDASQEQNVTERN